LALRQDELTSLCDDVDLDRDRALVERCQAGDSAAFGNLYARYYERLLRFCLRRLNDRHEAEDAAQEAFARAWKALPRFAGERRFYPWLTVIAGNICTDMLRRRSRSTPTDDMELTAQHPVGVVGADTSEDLVLAAVDGELVNRALGRLSTRHRHVLAMREGSGWTYQQIADHEGVEIGTIETLLWRARQALKREFAVVSESKEALAGFLVASGALVRRTIFRAAHRGASMSSQSGGGTGGGLRNAFAGVAVTGAAVAAAFIAPHALSNSPSAPPPTAGASIADPMYSLGVPVPPTTTAPTTPAASTAAGGSSSNSIGSGESGSGGGTTGGSGSNPTSLLNGLTGGTGEVTGGLNTATGGLNNTVNGVTGGLNTTLNGVTGGLNTTLNGLSTGLQNTTQGLSDTLNSTLNSTLNGVGSLLGGVTGSTSTGTSGTTNTPTSTTTTAPGGLLGGLGDVVSGLLGGH
jgi:RNA polymerase sigma-70 factor (ECF subfamily)